MSAIDAELKDDLEELSSAEDFLDYFDIAFDKRVVQVNRLHILQRFHTYLLAHPVRGSDAYVHYRRWLEMAYFDFVGSSAQEQKALRVFQSPEPAFVSLDEFES